ncbi:TetR/AcrR family transcriptional regulator [Catenulispora pinisilvae]|uniref:TetR/AcrR family transcriptional regulator n=1 Tax=Catenulispora pinisilvae TaxID=2705253 RepID=UPI00189165A4|nr:TetR/AcrR family transcriptional regulator [Catenulispora pinisilvae]
MPGEATHKEPEPRLRADARENRDRILDAARSLFAERGLEASMREVARYAEVGPATLYRRFPTKQALIDDVFADEVRACRQIVVDGCADPDPWHGFASVIEQLTVLNVQNQGFVDAFMSANPHSPAFAHHRAALVSRLRTLVTRAKRTGQLRHDFVLDDLNLILLACRGLSATAPANRTLAARRFAALALDGFRASETNGTLPRTPRLVEEAIRGAG